MPKCKHKTENGLPVGLLLAKAAIWSFFVMVIATVTVPLWVALIVVYLGVSAFLDALGLIDYNNGGGAGGHKTLHTQD